MRDGVADRRRYPRRTHLANALYAQRVGGRGGEFQDHGLHRGYIGYGGQEVVGKRPGLQLSLGPVDKRLQQRAAHTLRHAADELPFDNERIECAADVACHEIALDIDLARLHIDADLSHMHGEGGRTARDGADIAGCDQPLVIDAIVLGGAGSSAEFPGAAICATALSVRCISGVPITITLPSVRLRSNVETSSFRAAISMTLARTAVAAS